MHTHRGINWIYRQYLSFHSFSQRLASLGTVLPFFNFMSQAEADWERSLEFAHWWTCWEEAETINIIDLCGCRCYFSICPCHFEIKWNCCAGTKSILLQVRSLSPLCILSQPIFLLYYQITAVMTLPWLDVQHPSFLLLLSFCFQLGDLLVGQQFVHQLQVTTGNLKPWGEILPCSWVFKVRL